ncbi:MAG: hypothetical protein DLM73_01005 [Chthoniobacterales bacterium]|nr:MAG: hypothetical protein DLM73_01005 [Chthoniobacterales bacterium]
MNAKPLGDQGSNLSIMIPTFNCAGYLKQTLASLMAQTAGTSERAQIVVVDDCSTRDDPAAVVHGVTAGRVGFHRHSKNLGVCANLNACLDLAEREWIQILHGDDYMLSGAYEEFSLCLDQFPDALAVFARCEIRTSDDEFLRESQPLGPGERGRLSYDPRLWVRNPIYPAGVLLNRRVTEVAGKFDCTFSHVNDWNYWWRLTRTGQCVYTRACVAAYRVSEEGHSSSLIRSGLNVAEGLEQLERLIASLRDGPETTRIASHELYEGVYETAFAQCSRFVGDREAFLANWRQLKRMPKRFRWRKRRALAQLRWRHVRELARRKRRAAQASNRA